MAYNCKILRSAVEQEILFPSEQYYREYLDRLVSRKEPFQIISSEDNDDGTLTVVMRKRYNNNVFFLADVVDDWDEEIDDEE